MQPDEALRTGLVDQVVADNEFDETVAEVAARWAGKPTRAVELLKRCIDSASGLPIDQALEHEWRAVDELRRTADAAEGLQAFLNRRAGQFEGR